MLRANSTTMALSPLGKRRGGESEAAMACVFAQTLVLVTPLTRCPRPARCAPPIHPTGARFFDVFDPRGDQNPVARHHRHHHHGPAQEGPAEHLDAGRTSAETGHAAAGWPGLHAALRAGARGSGDAGILVLTDL